MSDEVPLSSAKVDAAAHADAQVATLEKELGAVAGFLAQTDADAIARRLLVLARGLMRREEARRFDECAYGSRCMAHGAGKPVRCWLCGRKDSCWLSGEY